MGHLAYNREGVELGTRGYVRCQQCGKEVSDISKETRREYAICLSHVRTQQKGDIMPAVPKPSQVGEVKAEQKRSHHKVKAAKKLKAVAKEGKPTRKAKKGAISHYAELKAMAAEAGGLTPETIRAECSKRGLSAKTGGNYTCYLKREKLVIPSKEAA
jgi:hypothetical protein